MSEFYGVFVWVHVIAAIAFILAHAISMVTAFQLRAATDRGRAVQLLNRSQASIGPMYIALLVLLVAGIIGGFIGAHWSRLWIWVSLGTLIVILGVMYAVAAPYYGQLRQSLGLQHRGETSAQDPIPDRELTARLQSWRPMVLGIVGIVGLAFIIWLMFTKPF